MQVMEPSTFDKFEWQKFCNNIDAAAAAVGTKSETAIVSWLATRPTLGTRAKHESGKAVGSVVVLISRFRCVRHATSVSQAYFWKEPRSENLPLPHSDILAVNQQLRQPTIAKFRA